MSTRKALRIPVGKHFGAFFGAKKVASTSNLCRVWYCQESSGRIRCASKALCGCVVRSTSALLTLWLNLRGEIFVRRRGFGRNRGIEGDGDQKMIICGRSKWRLLSTDGFHCCLAMWFLCPDCLCEVFLFIFGVGTKVFDEAGVRRGFCPLTTHSVEEMLQFLAGYFPGGWGLSAVPL